MQIRILDSSGTVFASFAAPASDHAILSPQAASPSFDPAVQPFSVTEGNWSLSYNGQDSAGHALPNGQYIMEFRSSSGSGSQSSSLAFAVIGQSVNFSGGPLGPNPVTKGVNSVLIGWSPGIGAEVRIYNGAGDLVRQLDDGSQNPPLYWDLRTTAGNWASNGIYLVAVRVPGERRPRIYKLAVAR